jgi:hypothetical protein
MEDKLRRFLQKKRSRAHWPPLPLNFGCYSENIPQYNESICGVNGLFRLLEMEYEFLLLMSNGNACPFIHQEKCIMYMWFLPLGGVK